MSVINNKAWYNALSHKNRISPHTSRTQRYTKSLELLKPQDASPSITQIIKRIARRPTLLLSNGTSHQRKKEHVSETDHPDPQVAIYMKSPHIFANGQLAGTLTLPFIKHCIGVQLCLIGKEEMMHSEQITTHQFMRLEIINMTLDQVQSLNNTTENSTEIPFLVHLPADLAGSFESDDVSIRYLLQSKVLFENNKAPLVTERAMVAYSNYAMIRELHQPVVEKQDHSFVHLSRSVWMAGAPIYVTVNLHNTKTFTIQHIQLDLVRTQIISCKHENTVIPISTSHDIVSTSAQDSWWRPLETNKQDKVMLAVNVPTNQVTVSKQKLINIAYTVRVSTCSKEKGVQLLQEIPVVLAHPVAFDPPSSLLSNSTQDLRHLSAKPSPVLTLASLKSRRTLPSEHQEMSPIEEVSTEAKSYELYRILRKSNSATLQQNELVKSNRAPEHTSMVRSHTVSLSKLNKMKRLGSVLSRKMSRSISAVDTSIRPTQKCSISAPVCSIQSLNSCAISPVLTFSPLSNNDHEIVSMIHQNSCQLQSKQRSILKFGQIKEPKRFGQQPGSLGDAGLDLRKCFNVATATEVCQSFAAEKVEIPEEIQSSPSFHSLDDITYTPFMPPVQLSNSHFKLKEGLVAPSEKCQVDMSMVIETDETIKYPNTSTPKRMLASSRHLLNLQRENKRCSSPHSI